MPRLYEQRHGGFTESTEPVKGRPLAESFRDEYEKTGKIKNHFLEMGFKLLHTEHDNEAGTITFHGMSEDRDGTMIEITVTRGKEYKSPKER